MESLEVTHSIMGRKFAIRRGNLGQGQESVNYKVLESAGL